MPPQKGILRQSKPICIVTYMQGLCLLLFGISIALSVEDVIIEIDGLLRVHLMNLPPPPWSSLR